MKDPGSYANPINSSFQKFRTTRLQGENGVMRTRNGKWIGPVPITLAAAFALAALLSVGLLVLAPNGAPTAQAQDAPLITAKSTLPEQYVDIGEEFSVGVADLFTVGSTIVGNQDWTATVPDNTIDTDLNTDGRQVDEDSDPDSLDTGNTAPDDAITISATDIQTVLSASAGTVSGGGASVGSLKVTVEYGSTPNEARSREFTLTVVHNPIEIVGVEFAPVEDQGAAITPHSCTLETNGAEPPVYQVPTGAAATARATVEDNNLIVGGACTTSKDSLEVSFVNVSTDSDDINHLVYVTGGSAFQSVQDLSGMFKISGLNEEILTLSKQTISGVGKDTITVSRSMANSDGFVYLIAYGAQADAANRIGATGKVFKGQAQFAIKVQFLGKAALGKDGPDEDNKVGAEEAKSRLEGGAGVHTIDGFIVLSDTDLAQVFDGTEATLLLTGTTGVEATSATIRATVQDANGNPLNKVEVTFTSTSVPADVESTTRSDDTDATGVAIRTISGLPTNKGYRVTVAVNAGGLDLGNIVIARAGNLVDGAITDDKRGGFTAMTCVADTATNKNKNDGCGEDYKPKAAFGVGAGSFEIVATVRDALGNNLAVVADTTSPVSITSEEDIDGISVGNFTDGMATVTITEAEVEGGSYTIDLTATQGTGDDEKTATTTVSFAISGELDHYAIGGDDRILPREIKTFVVEAQDVRNNPVEFDDDQLTAKKHEVSIFVDGDTDMISILDLAATQKADLVAGKETFRIRAHPGASGEIEISVVGPSKGAAASITKTINLGANQMPMASDGIADETIAMGGMAVVQSTLSDPEDDMLYYAWSSDDEMVATVMADDMDMSMASITAVGPGTATITVTATDTEGGMGMQTFMVTVEEANVAPMAGMAIEDQMVYVGAMVEVQSNFSDPDEDMLSYMASSSDDMIATATVDDMGMVTITGVAEGMATITVTASDPGELYAMQTIMVTVMMPPPLELGDPVVTGAMSDATGMATIMLTPGANADQHWIWAQPTDLSEGMFSEKVAGDATSANMTGLTSGMSYWFTAVAGRDMEDGPTEWSDYSGWSAETPIQ